MKFLTYLKIVKFSWYILFPFNFLIYTKTLKSELIFILFNGKYLKLKLTSTLKKTCFSFSF